MRTVKTLFVIAILSCFVVPLVTTDPAGALSNVSPNPSDMLGINPRNGNMIRGGVSHLLKKEDVALVEKLRVGTYFGSQGDKTLRIKYGIDGKKCYQQVDKRGTMTVKVGAGANQRTYIIPFARMCTDRGNPARNNLHQSQGTAQQRDSNKFFADYRIPSSALRYDSSLNYWYAPIEIAYGDGVPTGRSMGNSVNFILELAQSNAIVAPLANDNSREFGLRSAFVREDNDRSKAYGVLVQAEFGVPCSQTGSLNRRVALYDADTNVFGDTFLHVRENNSVIPLNNANYPIGDRRRVNPSGDNRFISTALEGSEATRNSSFVVNNLKKMTDNRKTQYRFVIRNTLNPRGGAIPNGNVMSIGIPFDSIHSQVSCNYNLVPSVENIPDTFTGEKPDFKVRGRITPSGNDTDNHIWRLTVRTFANRPNMSGATNSSLPCEWKPGQGCSTMESGTKNNGFTSLFRTPLSDNNMPAGTWVCFVMSVQKPSFSSAGNRWRHSPMKCSVSGKQPRVEFTGNDLLVGGQVTSRPFDEDGKTYGSWVEYAMMSEGMNQLAGSGAGLKNGNTNGGNRQSWNGLTFANTPDETGGERYGEFGAVMTGNAHAAFAGMSATTTATIFSGNNLSGTRIIKANSSGTGTVRINDNITVNNGSLSGPGQIPQVIIVANTILIDESVRRIDAWLVTPTNTGVIDTCRGATVGNLDATRCNRQLTVNGPIFTNQLKLKRTAGNDEDSLGQSAERFNLRPDAALWSRNTFSGRDTAQTVFVRELPPRY